MRVFFCASSLSSSFSSALVTSVAHASACCILVVPFLFFSLLPVAFCSLVVVCGCLLLPTGFEPKWLSLYISTGGEMVSPPAAQPAHRACAVRVLVAGSTQEARWLVCGPSLRTHAAPAPLVCGSSWQRRLILFARLSSSSNTANTLHGKSLSGPTR